MLRHRHTFVRCSLALAVAGLLAACQTIPPDQTATKERPPVMTEQTQKQITADQALQLLKEGNERFIDGKRTVHDYPKQVKTTGADGQFPFASIVSCIDSRSAPSVIFDLGIGDIFSTRVAGHVINEDILGSLEFASKVAGTKLIVILGHTSCGAVKGACDGVQMGNLSSLLAKIRPAVDATPNVGVPDRSSKNAAFVDAATETHVKSMVQSVYDRSPVLKEMVAKGEIKIVGAMLDVKTGKVRFLDS